MLACNFCGEIMKRKKVIQLIYWVLACFCLCSCKTTQKKQEIIPIKADQDVMFIKEEINLGNVELSKPIGIVADEDCLYICDSGNDRIVVWSFENNSAEIIGTIGSGGGEFISPQCVDINREMICVYDSGNYRIQLLKKDGTFISAIDLLDFFSKNMRITDIAIDDGGTVYFSVMLWHDEAKKAGLYSCNENKIKLIEPLAATAICAEPNSGKLCTVSRCEYINEKTWKTGYAEFNIYEDCNNTVKRAFSDLFSAVDIAHLGDYYYVFDDCSQSLYEFNTEGNCNRWVFEEDLPNGYSYAGFCADDESRFYLTETNEGKIYILTLDERADSE